jgi:ABC-type Fe3+ transport system permease subunit
LVGRSLTVGQGGLTNYAALFENPRGSVFYTPPITAVGNSLLFALAAVVLALGLGLIPLAAGRDQPRRYPGRTPSLCCRWGRRR